MREPVNVPYTRAADPAIPHHALVTAGPANSYPVQWRGQHVVVTLPDHVDVSNAGQIADELLSVINHGATELIADMTATVSCDYAGTDAMTRIYRRALVTGTQLRLVAIARGVQRVLTLHGLDRLIPVYPSLVAATTAQATATQATGSGGPGATRAGRPADRRARSGLRRSRNDVAAMTAFGRPGLDWTVVLRRRPARIVAGHVEGGYTDTFEIICCDCGDDPDLDYREVAPELQRIRGPYPVAEGFAAYGKHLTRHPNRQAMHLPGHDLTAGDRPARPRRRTRPS